MKKMTILTIIVLLVVAGSTQAAGGKIVCWGDRKLLDSELTNITHIAAGYWHSLGLKADGSIVAWGWNFYGQCNVPSPNTGFTAVAAGYGHSLGLKQDGSIMVWGDKGGHVPSPNTGFMAIAAGYGYSLGLKADGSIVAWGYNMSGQCNVPSPNTGFTAVAAGEAHSLGLKQDGSIVAWGYNYYGQCNVPSPNTGFTAIAAGRYHSIGLKTNGSIVAWGDNWASQCNIPSPNNSFIAIAAGQWHSLAIRNNPPVADAGQDQTIEANAPWGAKVHLDGSNSSDEDSTPGTNDDINDFDWFEQIDPCDPNANVLLGNGQIIDCNLPLGTHTIILEVTDKNGASDSNEVTIIVQDTTPPQFSLSVTPTILWPANKAMVKITPAWTVSDLCDPDPNISLVDIQASEPADSDIHTDPDGSMYLRAWRSGGVNSRIYSITFQAVDDSGNIAQSSATVTVPHDQRNSK